MKLANRVAIISGASQGLGFEIAKQFLADGARVAICARDRMQLEKAIVALQANAEQRHVFGMVANVTDPNQLQALVQETLSRFGKIDILVANAGVYGTKGAIEEVDWEEWSQAIDINLKGTVLQCRAVLPLMKAVNYGKIIILSGGGATKPLPNLSAYAASKAGVVRFAETLAEEVKAYHIDVNTVAPGALNTRLLDEILAAGPEKVGKAFYEQSLKQQQNGGTSLTVGAALCSFLASAESDGITGRLLSAVWDPWQQLPHKMQQLKNSDIYTLRRITPEDRGEHWGETQ
jgi:NAD(P)-dependent dehydrogenase (short-subunit alcohol dehydrogenase family)